MPHRRLTRREFTTAAAAAASVIGSAGLRRAVAAAARPGGALPLAEFGYGDVRITSAVHEAQLENTHRVLMNLSADSLLKPFRQMAVQAAPGDDLGG